jgi:hypothetical protein
MQTFRHVFRFIANCKRESRENIQVHNVYVLGSYFQFWPEQFRFNCISVRPRSYLVSATAKAMIQWSGLSNFLLFWSQYTQNVVGHNVTTVSTLPQSSFLCSPRFCLDAVKEWYFIGKKLSRSNHRQCESIVAKLFATLAYFLTAHFKNKAVESGVHRGT